MGTTKNNLSFPFFSFKNKETEKEILKIISQNEGVLPEKLPQYLGLLHSKKNAEMFIDARDFIETFWKKHNHLSISEVVGLFDMDFLDAKLDTIKLGNDFVKKIQEGEKFG